MLSLVLNLVTTLLVIGFSGYFLVQIAAKRRLRKKRDRDFAEFKRVFEQLQGTPIVFGETRTYGHPFVADTRTRGEN